jgi:hypothetical protein
MKSVDDESVVVGKEKADLIEPDADMSVMMRLRSLAAVSAFERLTDLRSAGRIIQD